MVGSNEINENLSQSYYQNFLNQLKDDGEDNPENEMETEGINSQNDYKLSGSSPNPMMDNYVKRGKLMKGNKEGESLNYYQLARGAKHYDSFIKVEELRKSKKFREGKIPTNTSFSGVDKNQIQNIGMSKLRNEQVININNKSFDMINYQSKRKSKFSKRNNKTHNFYNNVTELLKNAASSNSKAQKSHKKKDAASREKHKKALGDGKGPMRASTLNKRQRLNQSKLYQRRSVTTTRGVDISPQIKQQVKTDIRRPTSSSGVESYKRNY